MSKTSSLSLPAEMKQIARQICQQSRKFGFFSKKYDVGACNLIRDVGEVSPHRFDVPDHIDKPFYYETQGSSKNDTLGAIEIKTADQIERMRESCRLAANILKTCGKKIEIGMTTDDIDEIVYTEAINSGAYPSPLRYAGFPKSVCTSVNNVACHGIPDDRKLEDGDIINVDVTIYLNKYHGDTSKTFLVGNVDERGRYLVHHNECALDEAIKVCRPGVPFNAIGATIANYAKSVDLRVVPAFIGHGIGTFFHGPPEIFHFENDIELRLMETGMTFTIEPIFSLGTHELELWPDGWTTTTVDGARTSQFEHTILITDDGCEILTLPDDSEISRKFSAS